MPRVIKLPPPKRLALAACLWLLSIASSYAHEAKYSSAVLLQATPEQSAEELWFLVPPARLPDWLGQTRLAASDSNADGNLNWQELRQQQSRLLGTVKKNLAIYDDAGAACQLQALAPMQAPIQAPIQAPPSSSASAPVLLSLSRGATSDMLTFGFAINCAAKAALWSWSGEQPVFLSLRSATPDQSRVLGIDAEIKLNQQPQAATMLWLGAEHLLFGYDHLLFLATLLLAAIGAGRASAAANSLKQAAWRFVQLATLFTVAHSITLGLASIGVIRLAQEPVELIIAASILVSVALNYWRHPKTLQLLLVLFFGLVHGLGFAYMFAALLPADVAKWDLIVSLATFNLGIELAQLACALVALPLLYWLAQQARLGAAILHSIHLAIAAAAVLWVSQRI